MHYHCEIVMPHTDDVEEAVAEILKPFSEHDDENSNTFWDWFVLGGRWSGDKMMAGFDEDTIDKFYAEIKARKVTVSGVKCGKDDLQPASQIPAVDALWHELFPDAPEGPCPLFGHSGPDLDGDVMPFADVPGALTMQRIIFAAAPYGEYHTEHHATLMLSGENWNGVNFQKTQWDGTFASAVAQFTERFDNYQDEYRKQITPAEDWIVVTVDYHC